ncbi:hypothetical protein HanPI659440_Chr14g0541771 [Helianthus annuus]|nr:hypothetical protein HanPI659440_Chr14g0541771 [Helianthus annuus]
MISGPVLAHKGMRYREPENWKFGEERNKYFWHVIVCKFLGNSLDLYPLGR